jgi:hypothetical protein
MSKKRVIISIIILLIIAAGIYGWEEYNRKVKDLGDVAAEITTEAPALVKEFMTNEAAANTKYQNRIIAVSGMVKKVIEVDNTFTVVVGDTTDLSSVRCLIDSTHTTGIAELKRGMNINIKGAITGFKKDDTGILGSYVELNRCVINREQ